MNEYTQMIGWAKVAEISVGGLLYIGFSKKWSNKLLCISSQYSSLVNCDNGEIIKCEADFDEDSFTAICSDLSNEIVNIFGDFGGKPVLSTDNNERISIISCNEKYGNRLVARTSVFFQNSHGETEIFNDYGFYACSFSSCGNYFVLSQDTGITVLKRI